MARQQLSPSVLSSSEEDISFDEHVDIPHNEQNIVTQDELREHLVLREYQKQYNELRGTIRQALLSGAQLEPGMVGAAIRTMESKLLSASKLRKLLGEEQADEIVNSIETTVVNQLDVWEEGSQI